MPRGPADPKSNRAGKDIGLGRQGLQVWSVQRGEQIGAARAIPAHEAHVQLIQQVPDGDVQIRQREEPMVAQACPGAEGASVTATSSVAPPGRQPRPWRSPSGSDRWCLDGSLAGFARPRGQNGGAIMRHQIGIGPVQPRIEPVGLDHRRLRSAWPRTGGGSRLTVGNHGLWHAAQKGEHPDVGEDPIFQTLRGYRLGIGVIRRPRRAGGTP